MALLTVILGLGAIPSTSDTVGANFPDLMRRFNEPYVHRGIYFTGAFIGYAV